MSTQEHIQKSPQTQNNVEIPEFAVQSKTTAASPPPPPSGNLKTQLSRATRFGHNLTQMPAQEEQGGRREGLKVFPKFLKICKLNAL